MSHSLRPHGLYSPWNSPGQNTGVGSLSLLQGMFPTQGSNPGLLHCRWIVYQLSYQGSPNLSGPCVFCFFKSVFRFTAKLRGRYRDFPYTPCAHTCTASSINNTSPPEVLLESMNLSLLPKVHSSHHASLLVVYILWVWINV